MKTTKLERYLGYEFSSGSSTGQDYKTFQTLYINLLRKLCNENGWTLANIGRNHYEFSLFIKNHRDKYVYLSISDVRHFPNDWYKNILVRTAKSEKDYRGGSNNYTHLLGLKSAIEVLMAA